MATRLLGDSPWLVTDDLAADELAFKHHLLTERHHEVFAALDRTEEAGRIVLDWVVQSPGGREPPTTESLHALDRAGRCVQEDLLLIQRFPQGWLLVAASLCFPSQWRLADKMGRPMGVVHQPVDGYRETLERRVDTFFDAMSQRLDRIVWRRNWFVRPDWRLFQPERSTAGPVDPTVYGDDQLYLRSERQTLRALPLPGWILFTVRTQHARLDKFLSHGDRATGFERFIAEASPALGACHGLLTGGASAG